MIPKYSNPSVLLGSTAIVSRAALNGDSDDEPETHDTKDPEHEQMVARLDELTRRRAECDLDGQRPLKQKRTLLRLSVPQSWL